MRDIDLGKVTWTAKGAWNNATTFEYVDIVYNGYGIYISLQDGNLNHPTSDTNYWYKLFDFTQMATNIANAVIAGLPPILDVSDVENIVTEEVGNKYLSKLSDDIANGYIKFKKGLQIGETFVSGLLGSGGVFNMNNDGTTHIEADTLYIRMKAYFDTVEIRKYIHSGGNRIASVAGAKCVRVEWIDANGDVTTVPADTVLFRCYFRANDGETACTNDFQVGDQAYCKVTSAQSNTSLYQHNFWRMVVGRNTEGTLTDDDEYWIDLSNREHETLNGVTYSGYLSGSDAPLPQDDIIQLGNKNDSTRQGAIIEYVSGNNAPSYQIFQGINDFSLDGKSYVDLGYSTQNGRAYLNVYGDAFIGDKGNNPASYIRYNAADHTLEIKGKISASSTISGQTIDDYIASHSSDWSEEEINALIHAVTDDIQAQIDGQIESWFYNYSPVSVDAHGAPTSNTPLNVAPYSSWTTDNDKIAHLGDTFTNNTTGYCWRFTRNSNTNAFEWTIIEDSAVITALQNAARAQDTADGKRRVFICDSTHQTPTPPYDAGDLWVNVKYPYSTGATYNDEILKCITSKASTGTFDIADWSLSNGYTSKLTNFVNNTYAPFVTNIQGQVDKKAETWRQATDPSTAQGWVASEHVGDLWMDTSTNGGKKTYIYQNTGTDANPNYQWVAQDVPDEVFDEIDGKAEIFVTKPSTYMERDLWIIESDTTSCPDSDLPANCKRGDIVVADNMPSGTTKRTNAYTKGDWRKKDRYTDDTALLNFLNGYAGTLTNLVTSLEGDINTAGNRYLNSAVMDAIKNAVGGTTITEGGLMLTSLLAMRKFNGSTGEESDPTKYTTWGGLNGVYVDNVETSQTTPKAKGHGIAAWYGGGMVDLEDLSDYMSVEDLATWNALSDAQKNQAPYNSWVAKSVFRMDGSGYVANGNISWDADGTTRLRGVNLTTADGQTTIQVSNIASITYVDSTFLKKDWFNQFLKVHYKDNGTDTILNPNEDFPQDATDKTLESVLSFWTNYGITALGQGNDGSTVVSVLDDLNDVHLVGSPSVGQVLTYANVTGVGNRWTNKAPEIGGYPVLLTSITDGQVLKFDGTNLRWVNGTGGGSNVGALNDLSDVTITSVADKDILQYDYANSAWKNVTLSTALAGYATTSQLSSYLPLSGGTINSTAIIPLTIDTASNGNNQCGLECLINGVKKSQFSYLGIYGGTIMYDYTSRAYININSNGVLKHNDYEVYLHSGNWSQYINVSTIATDHISPKPDYTYTASTLPQSFDLGVSCSFVENNSGFGSYGSILVVRPYSGGGGTLQFYAPYSPTYGGTHLKARFGNYDSNGGNSWTTLKDIAWVSDIPTNNNQLTNGAGYITSSALSSYLPLSGGTINSSSSIPLKINNSVTNQCGIDISINNTLKSQFSYIGSYGGTIMYDYTSGSYINIDSNGNLCHKNNQVYLHSGNWSSYVGTSSNYVGYASYATSAGSTSLLASLGNYQFNGSTSAGSFGNGISCGFVQSDSVFPSYGSVMTMRTFTGGASGALQIYAPYSPTYGGLRLRARFSKYPDADWSDLKEIAWTDDISNAVANYLPLSGGTMSGSIYFGTVDALRTSTGYTQLHISNSYTILGYTNPPRSINTYVDGYEIYLRATSSRSDIIHITSAGNVGIGSISTVSYKLHVAGDIYATGGVTALSDIRKKDVVSYELPLSVEQIAAAPTIKFLWKDKREEGEQVGTIAQYWEKALPWVIKSKSGELSMSYGVTALIAAITTARKVVDHEKRITELEKECAAWKEAYSFIKNAYDELKLKTA